MVVLLTTGSLEGQHLAKSFFNTGLLGAAGTDAAPSDDQFNRVSFLSHFEGSNNGVNNAFDDGSSSNHTITANGNVTQGSFGPFARLDGEWGVDFDGSGDHLTIADSSDFDCGTGDFCLELFIFSGGASSNPMLVTFGGGFYLQLKDSMTDISFHTGSTEIIYSGSASLTDNAWHHIAITREGSSLRHFLDGSLVKTTSNSDAVNGSSTVYVGTNTNGSSIPWTGLISNLRLVNGSAVYTSAFTVPTSKLTAVTNTKLLTCQSNRFVDNSASAHTITPAGNAAVSAFGPFLTDAVYDATVNGASGYFSSNDSGFTDGTADLLDLGVDADFNFGTGDFSIEYWAYFQGTGGVVFAAHTTNVVNGFYAFDNPPRFEVFQNGGRFEVTTGETPPKNAWYHFVLSRQSGTVRIFANGVLKASGTNTASISQDGNRFCVGGILSVSGSNARNYGLKGYLTDFRVVKGSCAAAYQTSSTTNGAVIFTPPTVPLTAVTNTKLLSTWQTDRLLTAQRRTT